MRIIPVTAQVLMLLFLSYTAFAQVGSGGDCIKTYFNDYRVRGMPVTTHSMIELNDSSLLLGGVSYPPPPFAVSTSGVMETISKSGNPVSSKNIYYKRDGGVLAMVKENDGGVLTAGNASNATDYASAFARYDNQLNLQWETIFSPAGFYCVTNDAQGNTYFSTLVGQLFVDQRMVITKLDPNGQVIYRTALHYNDPFMVYGNYGGMVMMNNLLYTTMEVNRMLQWYTLLICINPLNGAIVWSKVIGSPEPGELRCSDQLFVNNNHLYMDGSAYSSVLTGAILVEMDGNGTVLSSRRYFLPDETFGLQFYSTPSGGFVALGTGYDYTVNPAQNLRMFMRLDPFLNILSSTKYIPPSISGAVGLISSADGYLYEAGTNVSPPPSVGDFYIRKTEPDGSAGSCQSDTLPILVVPIMTSTYDLPMTQQVEAFNLVIPPRTEQTAVTDINQRYCSTDTGCDTIFLSGPAAFCDSAVHTVSAHRTPGCTVATSWIVDPSLIKVISQNDSVLQYKFYTSGQTIVRASQFNGCRLLSDSMTLKASILPANIDLGPGRSICNKDTLQLVAPDGFSTYVWHNSLNADSSAGQSVIAQPVADLQYYLTAVTSTGCVSYGALQIFVNHSEELDLGNDTSICKGDIAALGTSSNNFSSYLWNTGAQTPYISVAAAGSYWLKATASNGCSSSDTVVVEAVYPVPAIALDHGPAICKGTVKILDADDGYASYLWNDGSTAATLMVQTTGTYWVKVTDAHGCQSADTTVISKEISPPHQFLPADTTVCVNQALVLKPVGQFESYSWSTGSNASSINITTAGTYILQATDESGCKGSDSIKVDQKDCGKRIYFPSAFSPNGDGNNDMYRPIVYGNMLHYDLQIYNRFGQRIFASSDYRQGWNGRIAGKIQDTGGYVWICRWQFADSAPEFKKGVLMLIK